MKNDQAKKLCLELLHADSEEQVIDLLKGAGFWDDPACWRYYGDTENNYGQCGNQQARSDSALVEKVVNSVDASLIRRCHESGLDPESQSAPQSIREAVAIFFEGAKPPISESAGRISEWGASKRLEVAREITVAVTGNSPAKGAPCITVVDAGEGQTPDQMPATLLSLGKSNKLRIPFVQGKFNMGGTGALEFCGKRNLQLVISRRHPKMPTATGDKSAPLWGFTVVRRDDPKDGRRHSTFVFLAPLPGKGDNGNGVLRFAAEQLPLFPENRDAYMRSATSGTAVKLYEYTNTGYSNTNALMKDGLMRRMDMLLPELALPVRIHECRKNFKGHEGSFANNMTGVRTRLDDDKSENLEFPAIHYPLSVAGEPLRATIYAFKRNRADTYAKNEGVIFAVNGQAHGFLTRDFFRRKAVGMSYLADSLLVSLDCSDLSPRSREILFMPSRDRLRSGPLQDAIQEALEDLVKNDPRLRDLKTKRREEDIKEKLVDEKPLEEVLSEMLKHSPTLSSVLLKGTRLPNPFKPKADPSGGTKPFKGKRFPTFFKFHDKNPDEQLVRTAAVNRRARIAFDTDADDNYFERATEKGQFDLYLEVGGVRKSVSDYSGPGLSYGVATIGVQLPNNSVEGDELTYIALVDDCSRLDPIENRFVLKVTKAAESTGGGRKTKPPGAGGHGNSAAPDGFALPKVKRVYEAEWETHGFDKYSALKIVGDESDAGATTYDFYVNADNLYLKTEMKQDSEGAKLAEAKFIFGMVLIGLGLIHEDQQNNADAASDAGGEESVEAQVLVVTRAVAPVLIPMINELGSLDTDIDLGIIGS